MRRLLLLEDEPAQQRLMRVLLADDGFEVCVVGTLDEVRSELARHSHDLLIADLHIEGEVVSLEDLTDPELAVLVVSAHDCRGVVATGARVPLVSKPYDVDELLATVRHLAGTSS